jgi:CheY-like chemotaxis protein
MTSDEKPKKQTVLMSMTHRPNWPEDFAFEGHFTRPGYPSTGQGPADSMSQDPPDLNLQDIMMPGSTAIVCRRLKENKAP